MMGDGPNPTSKHSKYSVNEDGELVMKGEFCKECKHGVFLGVHNDRKVCGKCGGNTRCECASCEKRYKKVTSNQSE